MNQPVTTPPAIAATLSELNAHARAFGCGKESIYAYKQLAALLDAAAGTANARPVGVTAKCHNCSGTGLFISWYEGQTNERCRTCRATGRVYLRFTETTIHGHVWHHPWLDAGRRIFGASLGWPSLYYDEGARELTIEREGIAPQTRPFESAGDWQPNTLGAKLPIERAAELLNQVEDWVRDLKGVDYRIRWPFEFAQQSINAYALEIGRIGASCHYCGAPETSTSFGHWTKHVRWSTPVCETHATLKVDAWDKRLPDGALGPHARAWLERRQAAGVTA
jgi:hypothetical protein